MPPPVLDAWHWERAQKLHIADVLRYGARHIQVRTRTAPASIMFPTQNWARLRTTKVLQTETVGFPFVMRKKSMFTILFMVGAPIFRDWEPCRLCTWTQIVKSTRDWKESQFKQQNLHEILSSKPDWAGYTTSVIDNCHQSTSPRAGNTV